MKSIYLIILLLICSCDLPTNEESNAVARVGEDFLFVSEIEDQIGPNGSDSIQITRKTINEWAEELLYLKKAEINLSSREKKGLEELVSTYRNDLYVKTYKDKAIQSQLDSIVEKEEIESYFEQNKLNFKTNKDQICLCKRRVKNFWKRKN